jgi:hypothetical protein
VFGAIQVILSVVAILLAIIFRFNAFDVQAALNASVAAVNFYIMFLLVFGFVFVVSGLFLVYDWWES